MIHVQHNSASSGFTLGFAGAFRLKVRSRFLRGDVIAYRGLIFRNHEIPSRDADDRFGATLTITSSRREFRVTGVPLSPIPFDAGSKLFLPSPNVPFETARNCTAVPVDATCCTDFRHACPPPFVRTHIRARCIHTATCATIRVTACQNHNFSPEPRVRGAEAAEADGGSYVGVFIRPFTTATYVLSVFLEFSCCGPGICLSRRIFVR